MFNDEKGMRLMALSLTHYVYRNTAIEDYHSEGVTMDMEFYKKIYNIVYRKIKKVKQFHKYIRNYSGTQLKTLDDLDAILKTVPEEYHLSFINYLQDILFGFKMGVDWEPANKIDTILQGKSEATFILSGKFIECCQNGCILDGKTMYHINKDIHNRIYSLLLNGYFD